MPKTHHLFTVTQWLLNAGMLFSLFLTAVLVLALGACVLAGVGLIHLPIPAEDLKDIRGIPLSLLFTAGAIACASGVFLVSRRTPPAWSIRARKPVTHSTYLPS